MKKNVLLWPLLAAVLGGVLVIPAQTLLDVDSLGALSALGSWLRNLSLSGTGGNIVAWAIVLVVSVLPALGLLWKGRKYADWLLFLAGVELFAGMYFLVNSSMLFPAFKGVSGSIFTQGWGLVSAGCVAGTLIAWVLLRLLDGMELAPVQLLPRVLFWAGLIYALAVGFGVVNELVADISAVAAANTDSERVAVSGVLLTIVALLEVIPQVLGAVVILWGGELARGLGEAPFEEETVALAEQIARRCAGVAKLSLLLAVAGNALQMLCVPVMASVQIRIQLPVLTLALCAVLFLLCRYFRRAKAVSDDNATII